MRKSVLFILAASLLTLSCTRDVNPSDDGLSGFGLEVGFHESRTSGISSVTWTSDDKLKIFGSRPGEAYAFVYSGEAGLSCGRFVGTVNKGASLLCALYPEQNGAELTADGTITAEIPTNVAFSRGVSVADKAAICVAEISGDGPTLLNNVTGAVGIRSTDKNISAVTLISNSGKSISGKVEVSTDGEIVKIIEGCERIKGTMSLSGRYYFNLIPGTYDGFSLLIEYSDGTLSKTLKGENTFVVERGAYIDITTNLPVSNTYDSSQNLSINDMDLSIVPIHPRLFATDAQFDAYRLAIPSCGNKYLKEVHDACLAAAAKYTAESQTFIDGGDFLDVSRKALKQMSVCAYAYRFTGEDKYRARVEKLLTDVCSFPSWHPTDNLGVAEMSTAVSLGYDWTYKALSDKTRKLCEKVLRERSLDEAIKKSNLAKFRRTTNWGEVLNGGMICTAVAMHDICPGLCEDLIRRGVRELFDVINYIYNPDGIYPEGMTYWSFGTSYLIVALSSLESCYGTDFGLSLCKGLEKTGLFRGFGNGNAVRLFNFSDCALGNCEIPELWYLAGKFKNDAIAVPEMIYLNAPVGTYSYNHRLTPIFLLNATGVKENISESVAGRVFGGNGRNPLVIARTGWKSGDLYVGLKGGSADNGHSHLDMGEFVYDAYGVRWSRDHQYPDYSKAQAAIDPVGGEYFSLEQDSWRWKFYGMNNKQHSTLTINDADQNVKGMAPLVELYDSPSKIGGKVDLTQIYSSEAEYVSRSAAIIDDSYLEIVDRVKAKSGKAASVRWTMNAYGTPSIVSGGISLKVGSNTVLIHAEGDTGVNYMLWPHNPLDYAEPVRPLANPENGCSLIGFTYTVPAGGDITITTTIKKQ